MPGHPRTRIQSECQDSKTYVQTVRTLWTKASRGAPAAARRNAAPEALVLPATIGDGPVLWHDVRLHEADDFAPRERTTNRAKIEGQYHEVALEQAPEGITVLALTWTKLELKPGETASVVFNMSDDIPFDGWHIREYRKVCFHIAYRVQWARDLFTRAPDHVVRKMHELR